MPGTTRENTYTQNLDQLRFWTCNQKYELVNIMFFWLVTEMKTVAAHIYFLFFFCVCMCVCQLIPFSSSSSFFLIIFCKGLLVALKFII